MTATKTKHAHQGKQLKEMVRLDPREKQAIAKKMGYTREHLYLLYKYPEFDRAQLRNIAKAGFTFGREIASNLRPVGDNYLIRTIKELEQKIENLGSKQQSPTNKKSSVSIDVSKEAPLQVVKSVEKLEDLFEALQEENEEIKNDLRNLNKKFNDLVFKLMTEPVKKGKVPANQKDLFAEG